MKFHRKNKPSSATKFLLKTIPQVSAADALFVKVKRAMERCRGVFWGANNADGVRQEPAVSKWNINNVTVRLPSLDSNLNMAAFLSFSMSVCTYRCRLFHFGWFYSQDSSRRLEILYPEFSKNMEEDGDSFVEIILEGCMEIALHTRRLAKYKYSG